MEVAKDFQKEKDNSGTIILAESQTQGKGREGRTWVSRPAMNLYFTLLLSARSAEEAFAVNMSVPIAIIKSCEHYDVKPMIKWPNDVWFENKKLSGMLINSDWMDSVFSLAVGVGINVNEDFEPTGELGTSVTSLSMIKQVPIQREDFLAHFCNHLEELLAMQFSDIVRDFNERNLLKIGTAVIVMPKKFEDHSAWYEASSLGVETSGPNMGCLRIQRKSDGVILSLVAEEVSVRPYIDSLQPK